MQPFTQKYVIVHFIEDLPVGYTFSMEDWPLHVTLSGVFSIEGTADELITSMEKALDAHPVLQAKIVGDALFGEHQDVPVRLVDLTQSLRGLHDDLLKLLEKHGAEFNEPAYIGDAFRPHATIQKHGQLEVGATVTFDSLSLVDMFPTGDARQRNILATIHF